MRFTFIAAAAQLAQLDLQTHADHFRQDIAQTLLTCSRQSIIAKLKFKALDM